MTGTRIRRAGEFAFAALLTIAAIAGGHAAGRYHLFEPPVDGLAATAPAAEPLPAHATPPAGQPLTDGGLQTLLVLMLSLEGWR